MNDTYVHPHALKHGLTEEEILRAWTNYIKSQYRESPNEDHIIRIGYGYSSQVPIQMVGIQKEFGVLIIHALTPPQDKMLKELGIPRRQK